jgi:hypothetical protein
MFQEKKMDVIRARSGRGELGESVVKLTHRIGEEGRRREGRVDDRGDRTFNCFGVPNGRRRRSSENRGEVSSEVLQSRRIRGRGVVVTVFDVESFG